MTPREIAAWLARHHDFLRTDDPTVSARQRSLDDTIEWSYQLLRAEEQLAFRRLGVFGADFGLDAASRALDGDSIDAPHVAELVWSLVSKSLVGRVPAAGSTRYRMLETVRSYSRHLLQQSGECLDVAQRLGHFYLQRFGPQRDNIDSSGLTERAQELDNVRLLIDLFEDETDITDLSQLLACTVVIEQRRAGPRAGFEEGMRLVGRVRRGTPAFVALLIEVARLGIEIGDIDAASDLLADADRLAGVDGVPDWMDGRIDHQRGIVAIYRGDAAGALSFVLAGLEQTNNPSLQARLWNLHMAASSELGDVDATRRAVPVRRTSRTCSAASRIGQPPWPISPRLS